MKKTGLLLMSIMGLGILVQAQDAENLVENPSFEQMEGKIKKAGGIAVAIGWMSPTSGCCRFIFSKSERRIWNPRKCTRNGSCYGR
jgi:hypothetical protein